MAPSRPQVAPSNVFYVVEIIGAVGRRNQRVISSLYETRTQAEGEMARLRAARSKSVFSICERTTHDEPAQWLSEVLMADGSIIHPPSA